MKLKELESYLGQVDRFTNPKIQLEQYNTSAHLAARLLYTAETVYGDITDRRVADFGTGSGVLAVGAAMLDSASTVGVDIDSDALEIAAQNIQDFELDVELIQANIGQMGGFPLKPKSVDTVLMNPPFGTRVKGIDMVFVEKALDVATTAVYSLHKSSTRAHFLKKFAGTGVTVQVVAEMKFDVPKLYAFHKKKSVDIQVDLLRFAHTKPDNIT